ncbi:MAG: ROK family transcriptional regulator [Trueperaceae bacterium]
MSESSAAASILFTIRDHGPLSRADVSRRTRLSQSAVSTLARELLERGVIQEVGIRREELGRPSIMLQIRPERAFFAGFSITGDEARGVLTDLAGTVRGKAVLPATDSSPAGIVALLRTLRDDLLEIAGVDEAALRGAGLALSGLIDGSRGACIQSTVLGWHNVPVAELLERSLGVPVSVENDANAVALGERLFGAAQRHDNFAVLSVGQGIGAGVFIAGRLHRGAHGVSSELGHCTIDPGGPECRCGKRGCLEAVAAVPVLLEEARAQGLDAETLDRLEELAEAGEVRAAAVLDRAGHALGLALSHLVNLFSPELVIVTGSGTRVGPTLEAAVSASYSKHVLPMLPDRPKLQFRHEDGAVWARGAAGLAASAYLSDGGEVIAAM